MSKIKTAANGSGHRAHGTIEEVDAEIAKLEGVIVELKATRMKIEMQADPEAYIAKRVREALSQAKREWEAQRPTGRPVGRPKGSKNTPASTQPVNGAAKPNGASKKSGKHRGRAPSLDQSVVLAAIAKSSKPMGKSEIAAALGIDKDSNALSGAINRLRAMKSLRMTGTRGSAVYSAK